MSGLYPTPTRIDLLRQVSRGDVRHMRAGRSYIANGDGDSHTVTARANELERGGWIEDTGDGWQLTDAGIAVLEVAGW